MRPRLIVIAVAAVAAVTVGGLLLTRGGSDGTVSAPAAFDARTVTAGDVTIELRPHHVDATGAAVEVTLDTHSAELDMDLLAGARLTVGGSAWPATTWEGDGPTGHHRAGRLRFEPAGRPAGTMELLLQGFDEPVEASWAIGDRRER